MESDNVCLAIVDPTREDQPALMRAVEFAARAGGRVIAYLCVYRALSEMGEAHSAREGKALHMHEMDRWLGARIEAVAREGVAIEPVLEWNERWFERAISVAARVGANLVVKSISTHRNVYRKLVRTSDFSLMRLCASPVLLVREDNAWTSSRIAVALDLESREAGHQRLNNIALTAARRLAHSLSGELFVLAVRSRPSALDYLLDESEDAQSVEEALAVRFGVGREHVLLREAEGDVPGMIVSTIDALTPDVLVLGTLARSGVAGLVIGNTAEKVLDQLRCDVLTVN